VPASTSKDNPPTSAPDSVPSGESAPAGRRARLSRRDRRPRPPRASRLIDTAGPDPATPLADVRLVVGRVIGAHGIRGELKIRLTTDDPDHLASVKRFYLGDEQNPRRLLAYRHSAGVALVRLRGIATPEAAAEYRGQPLKIAGSDARPLEPGEFYLYQLVGLEVFDEAGQPVGVVTDVMETGAHDVLVISPPDGGKDVLLPNHPDVVLDVDSVVGRMTVRRLIYDE
jgi:16S rRNA processing protein RimM